jgi:hypothetical protein
MAQAVEDKPEANDFILTIKDSSSDGLTWTPFLTHRIGIIFYAAAPRSNTPQ